MTTHVQQLTASLNASCHCIAADVAALRQRIDATYGDGTLGIKETHPHLFSAHPYFVMTADAARMQSTIAAIERVMALPAYQESVLARAPPIARHDQCTLGVFHGYDFHLTVQGPKLIEINTNAGGALLNLQLLREQSKCCESASLFAACTDHSVEHRLFAMFEAEWRRARPNQPLRSIAIVDEAPSRQYLYPEFLLFKQLFESRGVTVSIADPAELEFDGRALLHASRSIDLVYNRHTDFYFETPALAVLRSAYLANAAVVTPHPRAHALYADKRNLVTLTDTRALRELDVDESTIETLAQAIPQTLAVDRAAGAEWWARRKDWFFKPTRSYGSRGVYRGDKLTKRTFESILEGNYVAQRLAQPSERSNSHGDHFKVDVRNYVYDGDVQLIATRLYQGQTTNFRTPGGGFAPVFLIGKDGASGCLSDDCTSSTSVNETAGAA